MIGSLYTQSTYAILRSTLQLETIFKHAQSNNYDFVAITDNQLHGLYKSLVLSKKYNIPVILGLLKTFKINEFNVDLLIYARNDEELKNLIKLSSLLELKQNIGLDEVLDLLNKLVVVLPMTQQFIYQHIMLDDIIHHMCLHLKQTLKHFYIGISGGSDKEQLYMAPKLEKVAKQLSIDLLPTYLSTYETTDHKVTYEVVNKIKDAKFESLDVSMELLSKDLFLHQYRAYPIVFENVKRLFSNVHYSYINTLQTLPEFPIKDQIESHIYLYALAHKGLEKRLENNNIKVNDIYINRLNHELEVIHEMGYDDYFLIVYDFVRYAKTNDILVGPGRGSAAGSLVAYCLGITEVDPIKYDLLFERFLNIDRKTMPDIDLDFPDIKRDLVIDYVKNKYGKNHVVTMTTFTNLTTKTSMRDIARQMNLSQERINAIIASHTKGLLDKTDVEAQKLIKVAQSIEGIPRQTGTHPAGIILSKQDLTSIVPLMQGPKDIFQSQLEASDLESLGFLKIDFLGLKNLTMIEDILALEKDKIKLSDIPLDDANTFNTLSNADVEGIFQLESSGMKHTIRNLKPSQFEDIVAILALYRPGPMQFIDQYIQRRHGKPYEKIDQTIDDILKPTYGIIVYQEQIMKILQAYAGYNLSEADIIRRAISKKDHTLIETEKIRFIARAMKLNKPKEVAEKIYNHIEKFADYGFNRSHSVAYAFITYYMAYLKTHYYKSFITVLMNQNISNTNYLKILIMDAQNKGIHIYPPNVNLSKEVFIPHQMGILAPISMIKGISNTVAKEIIKLQPFKDYTDFKHKAGKIIHEKTIESLIHAGALDVFKLNHSTLLEQNNLGQTGFEAFLDDYKKVELKELDFDQLKSNELEVLGMNLIYDKDQTLIKLNKKYNIKPITLNDQTIQTIGKVESVKIITTKKGDEMAFVSLHNGIELDLTVFPKTYSNYKSLLDEKYLYIEATKDLKDLKSNKYIVNKIKKVKV